MTGGGLGAGGSLLARGSEHRTGAARAVTKKTEDRRPKNRKVKFIARTGLYRISTHARTHACTQPAATENLRETNVKLREERTQRPVQKTSSVLFSLFAFCGAP